MRYGQYIETSIGKLYMAEEDGLLVELGTGCARTEDCLQEKLLELEGISLK